MNIDPRFLVPEVSLNRLRVLALAGLESPPGVIGAKAYQLLSAPALNWLVRAHLPAFQSESDHEMRMVWDAAFSSDEENHRRAALEIARIFGERLGCVLLVLRQALTEQRADRPGWDADFWQYWSSISTIRLGGGLVSGAGGLHVAEAARALLLRAGESVDVAVADHPAYLPLIGLARSVVDDVETAHVYDFGGTRVKRARAFYAGQALVRLEVEPPLTLNWSGLPLEPAARGAAVMAHLVDMIAIKTAPSVAISIAAYVHEGQPLLSQSGIYHHMAHISTNVARDLSEKISERWQQSVHIPLLHDGTAAACALSGGAAEAVIMMGTALGVGFPQAQIVPRPLAPDFQVVTL